MRLINTETLEISHFSSEESLEYAILSHRWEDGEVTLQEMQPQAADSRLLYAIVSRDWDIEHISYDDLRKQTEYQIKSKKGYKKVRRFCAEARKRGYCYAWVDTCCIDKTSSAELSEAINSMFRWYQKAGKCFAYLSDVRGVGEYDEILDEFVDSEWFRRGWTLQELLAPRNLEFFDRDWQSFGTKVTLIQETSRASEIEMGALLGSETIFDFSVAQRMSWGAGRITTRPEDRAYSLLGIFHVNMPLIYGEGEQKAFLRLQEEIIKRSVDLSIFAWSGSFAHSSGDTGGSTCSSEGEIAEGSKCVTESGMLASSVDLFANSSSYKFVRGTDIDAFTLTNVGLSVQLLMARWDADIYLAAISCCNDEGKQVAIFLKRYGDKFRRVWIDSYPGIIDAHMDHEDPSKLSDRDFSKKEIVVLHEEVQVAYPKRTYGVKLNSAGSFNYSKHVSSQGQWDPDDCVARLRSGQHGSVASVDWSSRGTEIKTIHVDFDHDYSPRILVSTISNEPYIGRKALLTRGQKDFVMVKTETGTGAIAAETEGTLWYIELQKGLKACDVNLSRKTNGEARFLGTVGAVLKSDFFDEVWEFSFNPADVLELKES